MSSSSCLFRGLFRVRALTITIARVLHLTHDRYYSAPSTLDLASARALARDRDFNLARDLALGLASGLGLDPHSFDPTLADYMGPALTRDIGPAFTRDVALARGSDRVKAARFLNWLCVIEKRANGELPVTQALWIARTRREPADDNEPLDRSSSKAPAS